MPTASRRYDRHFLIPKPVCTNTIPALPEETLVWLAGQLGPEERLAMRYLCLTADILEVDGSLFLLVPVDRDHRLIDTLAAFEAEGEDREPCLEDEPGASLENDTCDKEPDYRTPTFADNARKRRGPRRRGWVPGVSIPGDGIRWREVR